MKTKILFWVSAVILSLFIGVLIFVYITQVNVFWRETETQLVNSTNSHEKTIHLWFTPMLNIVEMICDDLAFFAITENDDMARYFSNINDVTTGVSVMAAYLSTEDGRSVLDGNREQTPGFDPTTRGWYIAARANEGNVTLSEPYIDILTGELVVTVCKAIQLNNGLNGVVGVDVSLNELIQFIGGIHPTENGSAFLISESGNIITHADEALLPREENGTVVFRRYEDLQRNGIRRIDTGDDRVSLGLVSENGEGKYVSFIQIQDVGWLFGSEAPISDFRDTLVNTAIPLICALLLGLVIFAFGTVFYRINTSNIRKTAVLTKNRKLLTDTINQTAALFLSQTDKPFNDIITEGAQLFVDIVDIDRLSVFRNTEKADGLYMTQIYRWDRASGGATAPNAHYADIPYTAFFPHWETLFADGNSVNSIVNHSAEYEADVLKKSGALSVFVAPVFINNGFWGFVLYEDRKNERVFIDEHAEMLNSAAFLCINAYIRSDMERMVAEAGALKQTREMDKHFQTMFDTAPLFISIWNKDIEIIDCNENAAKLFGFSSKADMVERFISLTPAFQPCGTPSLKMMRESIGKAFETGFNKIEWTHSTLNGEPVPLDVPLVRIKYRDEYVVAAYAHDLREHKQMLAEIDYRSNLLDALNRAAAILLSINDEETFETLLFESMEVMGNCVNADRVQIWRNETKDGDPHFIHRYQWLSNTGRQCAYVPIGLSLPHSDVPIWIQQFLRNGLINKTISEMNPNEYELLTVYDIKTIVMIPLFLQNKFWGFFSLDNCREERPLTEDEINIMRSAGFMMISVVNRFLQAAKMREIENIARDKNDSLTKISTVNELTFKLFLSEIETFDNDLWQSMKKLGEAVDADRMYIWKNHKKKGKLYCSQLYEWSESVASIEGSSIATETSYDEFMPEWETKFRKRESVNDFVRNLSATEREALEPQGILSILAVPIYLNDLFWGFVGFDDCKRERLFNENEENLLRSVSMLFINAITRNEMAKNVRDTNIRLKDALDKAETATRAKSDFLAAMSHEIRTPMNAIIGIAQIQLQDEQIPSEYGQAYQKIYDSGNTLLGIINDILDTTKIETGKMELNPIDYDVPSLIYDAVQINTVRLGSKPIQFQLNADAHLPTRLIGDEIRLKQILNNLISNAIKYTDEGYVKLSVSHTERDGVIMLRFSVEDSGQGMSEEDQKVLFSEYSRFNIDANRSVEGVGLGLNITQRLVEMMDGTITVESEYGKGSIFTAEVKQQTVECGEIGAEFAEKLNNFTYIGEKYSAKQEFTYTPMPYGKVLIVDDVDINLYVAEGLLAPYKLKVDMANDGFEAINMATQGADYDIIFMDHMMPKMDGIETTQKLRSMGYNGIVIALTANALTGNDEIFKQHGFDGFISKPIDIRQLNAMLNTFVRDRHRKGLS